MKRYLALACLLLLCACHTSTSQSKKNAQILRTCLAFDIASFDPRKGVTMHNQAVVRMLFTGLVRLDNHLVPQLELAEAYQITNNCKTYTFTLKNCRWSDGSPITAGDFEQTWKAALSPAYSSANTNLFFHLKNGRKAFLGQISVDELGVKAIDDKTLAIDLEEENPHFLDILINSIFSPVHSSMRVTPPNEKHLITSGPFTLKQYLFQDRIVLEKNPLYWNAAQVQLQEIHYYIIPDPATALLMFEKGEIDWMGEPMTRIPADSIPNLKKNGKLHFCQTAANQWMFLNTSRFPFNNANIRKALSYVIDRERIMRDIMHLDDPTPSLGLIPHALKKGRWHPLFKDNDIQQAKALFQLGLQELGITVEQFPTITINYGASSKALQAIQQMWEKNLGIKVKMEGIDAPILMRKFYDHNFEIIWLGWVIQYNDPSNMLEVFKLKNIQPNYTGWENPDFSRYTSASYKAQTEQEKWENVEAAEKIFCSEMPSIPVTDMIAFYLKQPYVKSLSVNPLLQIDFDRVSLERTNFSATTQR